MPACLPAGDPKGVMIKHSAVVASVSSTDNYIRNNGLVFQAGERLLSYLPLAHIFDRYGQQNQLRQARGQLEWEYLLHVTGDS